MPINENDNGQDASGSLSLDNNDHPSIHIGVKLAQKSQYNHIMDFDPAATL